MSGAKNALVAFLNQEPDEDSYSRDLPEDDSVITFLEGGSKDDEEASISGSDPFGGLQTALDQFLAQAPSSMTTTK
jgi:hypothetical protein